ncbi:hypothetical protein PQX77_007782 [Marasmius sp. AFHP31]|nr:hypothetical protein PQX77_011775 [Marasmius sp. AFHP31]KAK1229210.1 hypothetical protein PQX77_007782 [Marasmius sp. AFHP31]
MQRASTLGNRLSYAQGLSQPANPAVTAAKLREKKKEYDGVAALDRSSAVLLERITGMMEDCDVMASAGEVHGEVLEQWPKMFQILNLFLASRGEHPEEEHANSDQDGQVLVRLPIDELQNTQQSESH